MDSRRLRPSEQRYARLLAKVTLLSPVDAARVITYSGRRARVVIREAARRNLDPVSLAAGLGPDESRG